MHSGFHASMQIAKPGSSAARISLSDQAFGALEEIGIALQI